MPTETPPLPASLLTLNRQVIACRRCPRLVAWREKVAREKRRAYRDCDYWGKPVPGFGDPNARVVILGLAPGAHGSNRTGRPFTGDSSGNFMYPVLHRTGFASQANGTHRGDGLVLTNAYITAAARCAPPQNKPTPRELANCAPFLDRELACLAKVRVVVALGRIGFDAYLNHLRRAGVIESRRDYAFGHGAEYTTPDGRTLVASYHPSNQNTNTGKLTEAMFTKLFERVAVLARRPTSRIVPQH
jgi:uracil-DNA glycosylase family 4